jgi:hypothetical protein
MEYRGVEYNEVDGKWQFEAQDKTIRTFDSERGCKKAISTMINKSGDSAPATEPNQPKPPAEETASTAPAVKEAEKPAAKPAPNGMAQVICKPLMENKTEKSVLNGHEFLEGVATMPTEEAQRLIGKLPELFAYAER